MLKKITIFVFLISSFILLTGESPKENTLVLKNFSLIDGLSDSISTNRTIIIKNGIIADIIKEKDPVLPKNAFIMNLDGLYVIPGLIDAHVHVSHGSMTDITHLLSQVLLGGITMIRDMGGDARRLAVLRRDALLHEIESPDIHYSTIVGGPTFFKDPRVIESSAGKKAGHVPWAREITPETNMTRVIAEARGCGATGIKIYANLPAKEIGRIVAEAHNQGLQTWSHATVFPAGPMDAVLAGVDVLSHTPLLAWENAKVIAQSYDKRYDTPYNMEALESGAYDKLFKEMAKRGTILDATVFIFHFNSLDSAGADKNREALAKFCTQATKRAHQLGVKVAVGTDFVYEPGKAFPNLHDEMELLVEKCGFTPMEVIRAATLVNAKTMGMERQTGTIEKGKRADMVILTRNPAKDIRNSRSLRYVIKSGRVYVRQ